MDEKKERTYRGEYEKRLQGLRLLDDDFMKLAFDHDTVSTGQLLQIILDDPDLTVTTAVSQEEIKSAYGKSVRLDVHAVDSTGKNMDIEVQHSQSGAVPDRARLNSAMLDIMIAERGDKVEELDNKLFGDGSRYVLYRFGG